MYDTQEQETENQNTLTKHPGLLILTTMLQ